MAVLNIKALIKQKGWKKLNPSARILLTALAPLTDRSGFGQPSSSFLMAAAGIVGKDTFHSRRRELEKAGFIKTQKYFGLVKQGKRLIPRFAITYQIMTTILWKTGDNSNPSMPGPQSMATKLMETGSEDVSSLDVIRGNNTAKAVDFKSSKESRGLDPLRTYLESKDLKKSPSVTRKWQAHAERIAKKLDIDAAGDKSWFKFFKKAHKVDQGALLDQTYAWCADYPEPKDKKRLFYWKFNQLLKERDKTPA